MILDYGKKIGKDRDLSFPKYLADFAAEQKMNPDNNFDPERDKMIIVFDGDIFENKVQGYEELISQIEKTDIAGVTNPGFELFLLLHIDGSYEQYIKGYETDYLTMDSDGKYSYAFKILHKLLNMNAKKNPSIGKLAVNVLIAISQEKKINQDIHSLKGRVSSNIGKIIENIINDKL